MKSDQTHQMAWKELCCPVAHDLLVGLAGMGVGLVGMGWGGAGWHGVGWPGWHGGGAGWDGVGWG